MAELVKSNTSYRLSLPYEDVILLDLGFFTMKGDGGGFSKEEKWRIGLHIYFVKNSLTFGFLISVGIYWLSIYHG